MAKELNLLDFLIVLAKYKYRILIHFLAIAIIAVIISCLLPKFYKSQVVFMPHNPSGSAVSSLLGASFSGEMLGMTRLAKRQYVLLLDSREVREKIIEKFNLVEVYKYSKLPNPIDKTLVAMKKTLQTDVEEEGGLGITNVLSASITAIDKDPVRASDMANYAYELLEKKVQELNRQEHDDVIVFLENQLRTCEQNLEQARIEKKQFQLEKKAYHVPQQIAMVLQAVGAQKAEMLMLESQKQYMKSTHSADYGGIEALDQKISAYNERIDELEHGADSGIFPGLTSSIDLADEYVDKLKNVEVYVQLMLLLRQQLEEAKVKKAKNYAGIYLIDKARPAQYKFKPKRAIIVLSLVMLYMLALVTYLVSREHFRYLRGNEPHKLDKFDALISHIIARKNP